MSSLDRKTQDMTIQSTQLKPLDKEVSEIRVEEIRYKSTWKDVVLGPEYSKRRLASAYTLAFIAATVIRVVCLSPRFPVFGPHLAKDLAPIERDDVSWAAIALQRAIDIALGIWVWSSAAKVDGFLLGLLQTGISKYSVLHFVQHHFLLSKSTVSQILLTDGAASAAALGLISQLLPRQPSFRPPPLSWIQRHLNKPSVQLISTALALGTCLNGLISYVADHTYLHELMKVGVVQHLVPSYFAQYGTAYVMKYPSLPVPTLRSDFQPLNMATALTNSVPFVISTFVLALFAVPSLPSRHLSLLVFLLTTPAVFITLWNLFPVHIWAASVAALGTGARQAVVAWVMAEVLLDLRKPVEVTTPYPHEKIVGAEIDGTKLIEADI